MYLFETEEEMVDDFLSHSAERIERALQIHGWAFKVKKSKF